MSFIKQCSCGVTFVGTGPAAKYCKDCKIEATRVQKVKNRERAERRRREEGRKIGRGAPPAEKHPLYKHGFYVAQTQTRKYKEKIRFCEKCGADLIDASRWHWVTHHKDHNHANHSEDNLELLCKRCHQIEHKCWLRFTK